jgi:FkbM family methyltransferase
MAGITSYAQNLEDVMLWRALKHVEQGFYIDIGAQDPVVDSVSLAFYEKGWRGIHVEPMPVYANMLHEHRPDETVVQAAISPRKGTLRFYEIPDTGLSTADRTVAEHHRASGLEVRETIVACLPLSEVFRMVGRRDIHWLKIDVEGWEKSVLESWGRVTRKPWIVVIEATLPNTQEESHRAWEHLLLKRGYRFVYFDGVNRFYVHESHRELKTVFRTPPNVFDAINDGVTLSERVPFCHAIKARSTELSNYVEQTQKQALTLQAELTQVKATAEAREHKLTSALEGIRREADAKIAASQAHAQWLQNEWDVVKVKIEELASKSGAAYERIEQLKAALQERNQAIDGSQQELAEERKRGQGLEKEWMDARMRIEALTHELESARTESEALRRTLQAELTQAQTTAEARERELTNALESARAEGQAHIEDLKRELEAEHTDSQASQHALQAELVQLKATAAARERELSATLESVRHATEAKISAVRARAERLDHERNAATSRIDELAGEISTSREHISQLETALAQAGRDLDATRRELAQERERGQSLQQEWNVAKAKIDELNQHAHHWWTMADGLSKALQAVYSSRSWRITKPLRVIADLMRRLRAGIQSIPRNIMKGAKALLHPVLARTIRFALARPAVRGQALAWLAKYPRLKTHLRNFAVARGLLPAHVTDTKPSAAPALVAFEAGSIPTETATATSDVDLARMTASAQRIYMDLKVAVEKHQRAEH